MQNLKENIEFVDKEYGSTIDGKRSLRLRTMTYDAALSEYQKSQMSKLIKAEKDLVNSVYQTSDMHHDYNKPSKAEKDLMKKAEKIAKLEEKIDFLQKEQYEGNNYVKSRAIKLKDKMMQNLLYVTEEVERKPVSKLFDRFKYPTVEAPEVKLKHKGYEVPEETKLGFFDPKGLQVQVEEQEIEPAEAKKETPKQPIEEVKEETVTKEQIEQAIEEEIQQVNEEEVAAEEAIRGGAEVVITPERAQIQDLIDEKLKEQEAEEEKNEEQEATEEVSIVYPAEFTVTEEPKEEKVSEMTDPSEFIAEEYKRISKNNERQARLETAEEISKENIENNIEKAMEESAVFSSEFQFGPEETAEIEEAVQEEISHDSDLDSLRSIREKLSLIQRKEQEMEAELLKADESVEMAEKEYEAEAQRVREYLEERLSESNAKLATKEQNYQQRMEENARREKEISERRAILAEMMNLSSETKESETVKSK